MNGVEILAVEQVAVAWEYNYGVFRVIFGVILVFAALIAAVLAIDEEEVAVFFSISLCGVIVAGVIAGLVGLLAKKPTEYVNEYKVVISENVHMVEFVERYEIIDNQGKIYTVRERENNNG